VSLRLKGSKKGTFRRCDARHQNEALSARASASRLEAVLDTVPAVCRVSVLSVTYVCINVHVYVHVYVYVYIYIYICIY